jgi:hypothetical protein
VRDYISYQCERGVKRKVVCRFIKSESEMIRTLQSARMSDKIVNLKV